MASVGCIEYFHYESKSKIGELVEWFIRNSIRSTLCFDKNGEPWIDTTSGKIRLCPTDYVTWEYDEFPTLLVYTEHAFRHKYRNLSDSKTGD